MGDVEPGVDDAQLLALAAWKLQLIRLNHRDAVGHLFRRGAHRATLGRPRPLPHDVAHRVGFDRLDVWIGLQRVARRGRQPHRHRVDLAEVEHDASASLGDGVLCGLAGTSQ